MRQDFPLLDQCLYFNTAYTAPLSKAVMDWRKEDDLAYFDGGDHYKLENEKNYFKEAREALAAFAGADKQHTFISSNFSTALQNFLIQLPRDYRFLSLKEEYPSLTGVVQDLGFETTLLPLTARVEENIWEALQHNHYDVLAISAIQYSNGFIFDFKLLERIKAAFPSVIILIDGTQFLGAEAFSLKQSPVDALFGSTYKWLMAGHGTGYALFSPSLLQRLDLGQERLERVYDRGQLSVKAVGTLLFSLKKLLAEDFPALLQFKKELSRQLFEGLKQRKLLDEATLSRKNHSSIFIIQVGDEVYKKLLENKVRCIKRGSGVRLSVHFYNTQKDVEQLFVILDNIL